MMMMKRGLGEPVAVSGANKYGVLSGVPGDG